MSNLMVVTLPAASNTSVAPLQTVGAGASMALNYSLTDPLYVVFPNYTRFISLTSGATLSAINFEIFGYDFYGNLVTEILAGPNGNTVPSAKTYHRILSITASASTGVNTISAGTSSVSNDGTAPVAISQWIPLDIHRRQFQTTLQCVRVGTVTYSITQTVDDLETFTPGGLVVNTPNAFPVTAALTAATTNQLFYLTNPAIAVQASVASGSTGSLTFTVLEQGVV